MRYVIQRMGRPKEIQLIVPIGYRLLDEAKRIEAALRENVDFADYGFGSRRSARLRPKRAG